MIVVGTHNGRFHADEVLACALLTEIKPHIKIIRTRNPEQLKVCDIVVDVGGVYDPGILRFDHHQKNCKETFNENIKIPLSSAGMVYKHFGIIFIENFIENIMKEEMNSAIVSEVYNELYYKMFQEVDANDNGVFVVSNESEIKYNYTQFLHYGQLINAMNGNVSNEVEQYFNFMKAVDFAKTVLNIQLKHVYNGVKIYYNDLDNFLEDVKNSKENILVMTKIYPVWQKYLSDLSKGKIPFYNSNFKFTVYPRNEELTEWGFGTLPVPGCKFKNQVDLLSQQELLKLLENPEDLIFVHKNLFCGSSKTLKTSVEACKLSFDFNGKVKLEESIVKKVLTDYGIWDWIKSFINYFI